MRCVISVTPQRQIKAADASEELHAGERKAAPHRNYSHLNLAAVAVPPGDKGRGVKDRHSEDDPWFQAHRAQRQQGCI